MAADHKIGIYTEDGTLFGYKADTFWTIDLDYAKPHSLEDGEIPQLILNNLQYLLDGYTPESWGALIKEQGIDKVLYVGIEPLHNIHNVPPRITHKIEGMKVIPVHQETEDERIIQKLASDLRNSSSD